jgi:hypothetical protein
MSSRRLFPLIAAYQPARGPHSRSSSVGAGSGSSSAISSSDGSSAAGSSRGAEQQGGQHRLPPPQQGHRLRSAAPRPINTTPSHPLYPPVLPAFALRPSSSSSHSREH